MIFIAGLIGVLALNQIIRRTARRFISGRVALSPSEFSALFSDPDEAALAPHIRDCLRGYIAVDATLVLPDDKLCEELQLGALDGLDPATFLADIERETGCKIPAAAAERMRTLRDIVSFVAAARCECQAARVQRKASSPR